VQLAIAFLSDILQFLLLGIVTVIGSFSSSGPFGGLTSSQPGSQLKNVVIKTDNPIYADMIIFKSIMVSVENVFIFFFNYLYYGVPTLFIFADTLICNALRLNCIAAKVCYSFLGAFNVYVFGVKIPTRINFSQICSEVGLTYEGCQCDAMIYPNNPVIPPIFLNSTATKDGCLFNVHGTRKCGIFNNVVLPYNATDPRYKDLKFTAPFGNCYCNNRGNNWMYVRWL
jgi:hypothetical protein